MSLLLLGANQFNVKQDLFSNNEQGLWLDPSDMTAGKAGWRRNLLLNTEPADSTGYSFATNISFVTESAFSFLPSAGRAAGYGDSSVNRRLQFSFTSFVTGQSYTLSFYIYLDGGVEPNQGAGSYRDFTITRDGSDITNYASITYDNIGGGVYRVKHTWTHTGIGNTLTVWKYAGLNTNTNFRASGFQLELGSTPTEYQRITDFSTEFKAAFPTHTLYQDSSGVTPCTDSGQPVGLILDQSRGGLSQIGADLVTNGTFAADTDWTKGANWTIGSGVATKTGGAANNLTQTIGSTAAAWYRISLDVTRSAGTLTVSLGTSGTTYAITATGSYTFFILAGSGTQTLTLAGDSSFAGTVDNVVVRNVPGNHASQSSSSARPTLARIPSSGRRNLLTRTEEFDNNSVWAKDASSATANATTAPDGTLTADRLVPDNTSNVHRFRGLLATSSVAHVVSFYAKAGEISKIAYREGATTGAFASFDLSNGTVINQGTGGTGSITSAGNGWYRCSVSFTAGATTRIDIIALPNTFSAGDSPITNYTFNGTDGVFVWGAQLETGSSVSNYQKVVATTDVTESGVSDLWHLVFDGSDDSLVCNSVDFAGWTGTEAKKNLLVNTSKFGAWPAQNGCLITENTDIGPSGSLNADTLTNGGGAVGSSAINQTNINLTANATYTLSIYLKSGTSTSCVIGVLQNGSWLTTTNTVLSGTATFAASPPSNINNLSSSWSRVQMVFTAGATGLPGVYIYPETSGVGTGKTVVVADAQLELGNTATSYQEPGTDEMTVIAGVRKLSDAAFGAVCELTTSAYTTAGGFWLLAAGGASIAGSFWGGALNGSSGYAADFGTYAAPITNIVSLSMDTSQSAGADELTARVNGLVPTRSNTAGTNAGTGNFANSILYIGRRGGSSNPFNGHLYQLIIRGKTTPTGKLLEAEKFVGKKTGVSF